MDEPILADQIRAFTFKTYIEPALGGADEVSVRAGDVHKAMNFNQRVPLVCGSLRAKQFGEQYGLTLVRTEGPLTSTTTTFFFVQAAASSVEPPISAVVWAEITSLEHSHGGLGWELGRWLWSPTVSKDGADRYAIMAQPQPGDQVFHLVAGVSAVDPRQRVLFGTSRVAAAAERTIVKPPLPGTWADAEAYFRIRLANFVEFPLKPPMGEVESELEDVILADLTKRPKYYPYAPYRDSFRGVQGIYLTKLSLPLSEALREMAAVSTPGMKLASLEKVRATAREFAEGERARRETQFFRRNPALRALAIAKHGIRCKGCGKSFGELYGPVGEGYIEIHHLNPLAERIDTPGSEPRMSTVDDVIPLCANCHRMVHRRRPSLSIEELQLAISTASKL